jgi:two-component system nitrate/nitrite response regulator NarL
MIKLLIIDDHPLIIDGIRTMLKDTGYVEIAGACKTAREGLAFIVDHPEIDIVLLDINLPDMDGLRACELIRQIHKQVKIIGLTYVNEAGIITQLIRKGANGHRRRRPPAVARVCRDGERLPHAAAYF